MQLLHESSFLFKIVLIILLTESNKSKWIFAPKFSYISSLKSSYKYDSDLFATTGLISSGIS